MVFEFGIRRKVSWFGYSGLIFFSRVDFSGFWEFCCFILFCSGFDGGLVVLGILGLFIWVVW